MKAMQVDYDGWYKVPVYKVMLVKDGSAQVPGKKEDINNPSGVVNILRSYMGWPDREHFIILFMDRKNRLIGINTASIGSLFTSVVHPREVFKQAILANAAAIIIAHNHPSGDPTPSVDDRNVLQMLIQAGNILNIEVLDSIILGDDNRYYSAKEAGEI